MRKEQQIILQLVRLSCSYQCNRMCVYRQKCFVSLCAAVILTNLSDWKDIFGSYYLYFRSHLDKRASKWMGLSPKKTYRETNKIPSCVCLLFYLCVNQMLAKKNSREQTVVCMNEWEKREIYILCYKSYVSAN